MFIIIDFLIILVFQITNRADPDQTAECLNDQCLHRRSRYMYLHSDI